jgi:hypothetical protein
VGIDKGWDYDPATTAWGKPLSAAAMNEWRAQGAKAWERLTPGSWQSQGRPERIPADTARAVLGPKLTTTEAAAKALRGVLGGEERIYALPTGGTVLVNAESLASHIDLDRTPYLSLLPEVLEDPYEVWLAFEQHKGTGKVVLRQRLVKLVQLDKKRAVLVTAQAKGGVMEAWTLVPTSKLDYLNKQREGKLLWGREVGP